MAAVRWLFCLLILSSGPALATGAARCPVHDAAVSGANEIDFKDICQGIASALAFFAAHGLEATEPLSVQVAHPLPKEAGPTASGCFVEYKRTIYVAPFTEFRKNATWFGVALATHEAAHAVASYNFSIPNPTIQAKEYLAYVAMFASMPAALRQKALAGMPAERFDSFDRFTPLLYMFDPMRFGAGAYRHFSALPDPSSVIRTVLTGKALTD